MTEQSNQSDRSFAFLMALTQVLVWGVLLDDWLLGSLIGLPMWLAFDDAPAQPSSAEKDEES